MALAGLDTETALIGRGRKAPPMVCYSVAREGHSSTLHRFDDRAELFGLWHAAARGEITLVFQNAPFDAAVTVRQYPELMPVVFGAYAQGCVSDVMIREILLDIEIGGRPFRSSLEKLTAKYLGRQLDKGEDSWRLRYWDLRGEPVSAWPKRAVAYAKGDAEVLIPIRRAQDRAARYSDTFGNEAAQCRAHFALHLMATWGLKTDVQHVEALKEQFESENDRRRATLQDVGIVRKNGSVDTKALIAWIEQGGYKLPKTPTGRPSLKAEILESIDDPIITTYSELKRDTKLINTYLAKYESGLVQCTVNPILANGRNSLSKPSLQNLPKKGPIRESFVPREGRYLCSIDYDGIELRTLAQACLDLLGHSEIARTFQKDPHADLHTRFAAGLLGISPDDAMTLKAADDPRLLDARHRAKAANFGFPGGMGIARFVASQKAQGAEYTHEQAKALKYAYLRQWPEMQDYFRMVGDMIPDSEGVATIQCLRTGRRRGNASFCEIANGFFSSLMADGTKAATFEIARQCYAVPSSPIYGARIVNSVHDELLLEFDRDTASAQAQYTADLLCRVMHDGYTPDVPITAEPALMRRWFKKAKPVYDDSSQLIPWEPKS